MSRFNFFHLCWNCFFRNVFEYCGFTYFFYISIWRGSLVCFILGSFVKWSLARSAVQSFVVIDNGIPWGQSKSWSANLWSVCRIYLARDSSVTWEVFFFAEKMLVTCIVRFVSMISVFLRGVELYWWLIFTSRPDTFCGWSTGIGCSLITYAQNLNTTSFWFGLLPYFVLLGMVSFFCTSPLWILFVCAYDG